MLRCLKEHGGVGIPAIKSWEPEVIKEKIRMARCCGSWLLVMMLTAPAHSSRGNGKAKTYPKSVMGQLKEIFLSQISLILKRYYDGKRSTESP